MNSPREEKGVEPIGEVSVTRNVSCRTRDGTVLRADVYRPSEGGSSPVLLCRTCYDKSHARYRYMASELARRGYIAVVQDIRGRHSSEGEWAWHLSREGPEVEQRDGYDACEWAARIDGSDGQVGTFGNSYPSWCIWQMAAAQPPSLKAIFTSGFPVTTLESTFGVFETGIRLRWHHQMAVSTRRRSGDSQYPATEIEALHNWDALLRGKHMWQLPLSDIPDHLFGPDAERLRQYWRDIAVEFYKLHMLHPRVGVPTCTLTGWWDRINGAAGHFTGMEKDGPKELRGRHRLIIGPWTHDVESTPMPPVQRCYGPKASLNLPEVIARWYDYELKGQENGLADEPPVRAFMLNENEWRFMRSWPPPSAKPAKYFFAGRGPANTNSGAGELSKTRPTARFADFYIYDPSDPVPSLVGTTGQADACDQSPLRDRADILVYQTAPLEEDLPVLGPVHCVLTVSSSCPDTDFFARLIEVGKDGLAINLAQGMKRMRYRDGYAREAPLEPGKPTRIEIQVMIAGIVFRAGSRIRLDVTSSDFPAFDRNHNTGRPFESDAEIRVARQSVHRGGNDASHLILPVLAQ
ncbi:MAG: CocE/NonD family hydrolase [Rhodobacteraceae bacterium]|nr:CocE/NonD family hydrolase [Paracoccaceae bacterium]MCY4136795.1 CocE/NonD family hydrolase [Paracoccaceae bacterium]